MTVPPTPITRARFLALAAGFGASALAGAGAQSQAAKDSGTMQTRVIPKSGEKIPVVGCGTWQGFDVGGDAPARAQLTEVVSALFAAGGSVLDSSPMYGTSEEVTGAILAGLNARPKAFIATKVWTRGKDAGIAQIRQSMGRLQTKTLDLLQVHNLLDWRVHLATLRDMKNAGTVRYVGVTHYTSSAYRDLEAVLRAEPLDFVQVNYSADDRAAEERILPLAAERGVAVLVNLPFGGGGLLRNLRGRPLPAWAGEVGCESWSQLLLKFVLGHPAVTSVIPGTGNPAHMRENAQAGSGAPLDEAARRQLIAELSR